jgi:calcineurin-like phosphoesterase family protein
MSDLHYGHKNILEIDKRPYESIEAMNEYIVRELKTKLRTSDILFDLGDLFWKSINIKECRNVLDSIPTKNIYKVVGNHDPYKHYIEAPTNSLYDHFLKIGDIFDIRIEYENTEYEIALSHYPILDWNHMYQGGLHIYGHTHGHTDRWVQGGSRLMVDIGFSADLAKEYGSFIIPFETVLEHFKNKTGGMSFKEWAQIEYHKPSMWNEK